MDALNQIKMFARKIGNVHRPNGQPDVFIFSTARSGSTLLMELIQTQDGFKSCNEPLNFRIPHKRKFMGIGGIEDLYFKPERKKTIRDYFQRIKDNRIPFYNYTPFNKNHRFLTTRIVFKVLQAGDNMMTDIREFFDAKIIYLFRHPIAVTLSRNPIFPRIQFFKENPEYRSLFNSSQIDCVNAVISEGDPLECGVVSWCLENYFPMHNPDQQNWILLSYEELVLNPEVCLFYLAGKLNLKHPERMIKAIGRPSKSIYKSDRKTINFLNTNARENKREWLIKKWREKITLEQEQQAFEILEIFNIHAYRLGEFLPVSSYLISETIRKSCRLVNH